MASLGLLRDAAFNSSGKSQTATDVCWKIREHAKRTRKKKKGCGISSCALTYKTTEAAPAGAARSGGPGDPCGYRTTYI